MVARCAKCGLEYAFGTCSRQRRRTLPAMVTRNSTTPSSSAHRSGAEHDSGQGVPSAAALFEVSDDDIERLGEDDKDFRELVARLCQATLAGKGLPTSAVTWGGNQNEPDGGIDVRVVLDGERAPESSGWLPRCIVGIQVKATKMEPHKIRKEMRRGEEEELLPAIKALIDAKGAYIIAARDSVADAHLQKRLEAMEEAVKNAVGHEDLHLDYYDRRCLADWANEFPSVVAWVQSRLPGGGLHGWRPYGRWAGEQEGEAYLADDTKRFFVVGGRGEALTVQEGLKLVRTTLRGGKEPEGQGKKSASVRLVGLSGVGKTRFVQALFEDVCRKGKSGAAASDEAAQGRDDAEGAPLPETWAIYTDTAWGQNPSPLEMLDVLLQRNVRAVLIVDNCGAGLHKTLTTRLEASSGTPCRVSLLTIEYDIREDLPHETEAFRLESASDDLIENILTKRFTTLSWVNVQTIARFSGGNARVAIALAGTVEKKDSLAGLRDVELFDRLFWQRNQVDEKLRNAAQACALVYSFNGEDVEGHLARLAVLADMSVDSLYRHVAELQRRGLVQQRGDWRAVLPHAIANMLAERALESIPYARIEQQFTPDKDEHLLRSFSRRLGYLHGVQQAVKIVRGWLSPDGGLDDVAAYLLGGWYDKMPVQMAALVHVAPVDPEGTLEAIERGLIGPMASRVFVADACSEDSRKALIHLLRKLAYDAKFFDRCMDVLARFAQTELAPRADGRRVEQIACKLMESLFWMRLSGTLAPTEQRVAWLRTALQSADDSLRRVAVDCLSASLDCSRHGPRFWYSFEFGARQRDFGWTPKDKEEEKDWFERFISLAKEIGSSDSPSAAGVRQVLSSRFRSLWRWRSPSLEDALEQAARALRDKGWAKGWIVIRNTLARDEGLPEKSRERLQRLVDDLQPVRLVDRVTTFVLHYWQAGSFSFEEYKDQERAMSESVRRLGVEAARAEGEWQPIAELVTKVQSEGTEGRQRDFGLELAEGASDLRALWVVLVNAFESHSEGERNVEVLCGFLSGVFKRDQRLFNEILDAAMERPILRNWIPLLQASVPIDGKGYERLIRLLDDESKIPEGSFSCLPSYGSTQELADGQIARLIEKLHAREHGADVAFELLFGHCEGCDGAPGPLLRQAAYRVLESLTAERWFGREFYDMVPGMYQHMLERLAKVFLSGQEQETLASVHRIIGRIRDWADHRGCRPDDFDAAIAIMTLIQLHPSAALDMLVGDGVDETAKGWRQALESDGEWSIFQKLSPDDLLAWCRAGTGARWVHVAPLVQAWEGEGKDLRWSAHARALIESAPEPFRTEVADSFAYCIASPDNPRVGGALADDIAQRLPLFEELKTLLGPAHIEHVEQLRKQAEALIEKKRKAERQREKMNAGFE